MRPNVDNVLGLLLILVPAAVLPLLLLLERAERALDKASTSADESVVEPPGEL
jgi:hypothetical protein